ncbi:MAG: hypothetical protein CMJ74_02385 [Planctomycetaceae bacterium]|nr:hypothetical protein [Planctomycetaceae bacterium]
MQFLRCFSAPLTAAKLPLIHRTADALFDVLLAPTCDQRSERLIDALQKSPPLAIWMLDRCLLKGITLEVPTLSGMVNHVVEDLAQSLIDSLNEPVGNTMYGEVETAETVAVAVAAIRDAVEVSRRAVLWLKTKSGSLETVTEAHDHHQEVIEVARCLGLLCTMDAFAQTDASANLWLSREKIDVMQGLGSKFEPFLSSRNHTAVTAAVEAIYHGLADWKMERIGTAEPDEALTAFQREWANGSAASDRLRQLTKSLCRLDSLERDFSAALEESKLQAMYKLAAGAGHEINNPLGSIAGRAQLLLRDESDPERRRTLAKINSQAFRAHEMIADMMLFARPPLPQLDQITPAALIQSLVDEMQEMTQQQDAEMVSHVTTEIATLRVDPSQLRVALRAMCTNALEAIGLGGRIEIHVSDGPLDNQEIRLNNDSLHAKPTRTLQITIRDNGPGFSEEERQHLFDPFYSGREAGRGLGFGLSKCWRIVRNHGGWIDVHSDPGRGATFEITLPVA